MRQALAVLICVAVAGCATPARKRMDEGAMWRRADCGEEGTAESSQKSNLALTICRGRAQASGESAAAAVPAGYGTSGAIASGIQAGMTQVRVSDAIMVSCMAEQGYMLRKEEEQQAICAALKPAPQEPLPRTKRQP